MEKREIKTHAAMQEAYEMIKGVWPLPDSHRKLQPNPNQVRLGLRFYARNLLTKSKLGRILSPV